MNVILDYNNASIKDLVYVKSNIGGWFFDAIIHTDYTRELYITENPVETGSSISDHSYIKPVKLTMEIKMSDCMTSRIPGQFNDGDSRSLDAFQVLAELQQQRIPVRVMTRLGKFDNMLIQSINVPDDVKTLYGLDATVILQEIFVAQTTTVKISANAQVTDSTNRGTVEPVQADESLLYQGLVQMYGETKAKIMVQELNKKVN